VNCCYGELSKQYALTSRIRFTLPPVRCALHPSPAFGSSVIGKLKCLGRFANILFLN
jgi:hypothetical protein